MNEQKLIKTYEKDFAKPVQILSEAQKRQAEIDAEKEAFFAQGGKVTELQSCVVAQPVYLRNEFTGANDVDVRTKGREKSTKVRKRASMNSKFYPTSHDYVYRSDVDQTKFVTIIGAFISMQFDTEAKAVNCRDFKLSGR